AKVLLDRREQPAALSLELDAQDIDHVAVRQDVVEPVSDFDAQAADLLGNERGRAANDDASAELDQTVDIASGHTAMGDVAHQPDGQSGNAALDLANREDV